MKQGSLSQPVQDDAISKNPHMLRVDVLFWITIHTGVSGTQRYVLKYLLFFYVFSSVLGLSLGVVSKLHIRPRDRDQNLQDRGFWCYVVARLQYPNAAPEHMAQIMTTTTPGETSRCHRTIKTLGLSGDFSESKKHILPS